MVSSSTVPSDRLSRTTRPRSWLAVETLDGVRWRGSVPWGRSSWENSPCRTSRAGIRNRTSARATPAPAVRPRSFRILRPLAASRPWNLMSRPPSFPLIALTPSRLCMSHPKHAQKEITGRVSRPVISFSFYLQARSRPAREDSRSSRSAGIIPLK